MARTEPTLTIRPITRAELETPLRWAADEGWNPGLDDAGAFHAADPNGFLMAFLEDDPVGSISVVRYDDHFGFLGLYIVRPAYRRQGYGIRLWQAGLRHLEGCVVGLDGVVAQQAKYARSGFILAYRNVRYSGRTDVNGSALHACVRPVEAPMMEALLAYDRRYFPADRPAFLHAWLDPSRRPAYAYVEDGRICGYGVLRACREGFKIGPLFAETSAIAEELLRALVIKAGGALLSIDVPEPNGAAGELARRFRLAPVFETARMYRGSAPDVPLPGIYGVTTFELG